MLKILQLLTRETSHQTRMNVGCTLNKRIGNLPGMVGGNLANARSQSTPRVYSWAKIGRERKVHAAVDAEILLFQGHVLWKVLHNLQLKTLHPDGQTIGPIIEGPTRPTPQTFTGSSRSSGNIDEAQLTTTPHPVFATFKGKQGYQKNVHKDNAPILINITQTHQSG
jgi:hypothetical protein